MMPHSFVVNTVTDAAREVIASVGGSIEGTRTGVGIHSKPAHLVTLPSQARMGTNNYAEQRGRFDARWCRIEVSGVTLQFTNSLEDKGGTLDLVRQQEPEDPEYSYWNGRQWLKGDNLLRPSIYEREA